MATSRTSLAHLDWQYQLNLNRNKYFEKNTYNKGVMVSIQQYGPAVE